MEEKNLNTEGSAKIKYGNAIVDVKEFKTQDDPGDRKWTWEEDGYTVFRGNARTGPGCHDNCGVLMYVKDGVLEKIEGDPENPYNQGRLCPRCLAVKEMLYHPDRLKYPMKRVGKRGENKWERLTWDEAYDFIEESLKEIFAKYGPESIYVMQGTGRDINGYGGRVAQSMGSPNYGMGFLSGNACYVPRVFSTALKLGVLVVGDYSQFFPDRYDHPGYEIPEYILIWGNNPVVSNSDGFLGHWIVECMKRGSKLITIDPKLTWLAARSEYFLQVRPGTDAALALAFANVICEEGLYDKEFVEKWTYGFEEYAEHCKEYTPEKAAEICGVDASLIRDTARAFAKAKSATLQWGVAMDHTSEGFITGMACMDLVALTGNLEKPGSMVAARPCFGVAQTWSGRWGGDKPILSEEQAVKRMNSDYPTLQAMNCISQDMLLKAMLTGEPYPIKATWMQTNNPITCMGADPKRILEALLKMEFNVVVDMFMTPTALAAADVVLPAAGFAERIGLTGHQPYYLGAIVKAVEPVGECKSDQQIIYEMGKRFRPDRNEWNDDKEFYNTILEHAGITYDDIKERTWAYPEFEYYKHEKGLLRSDGEPGFETASGKYEFKCEFLEMFDMESLAIYTEPPESPVSTPELAEKYPLVLTTGARRWALFHSEHRQSPSMRRINPEPMIIIHPETAAKYGIKDGDWVEVENNFGKCKLKAELTISIRKDTVSADHAWWFPERDPEDGTLFGVFESNINCLVPMRPGKSGIGASYKSLLCKISKHEGSDQ
ncbi:molybdopterin-dependent oxidoreductase [Sporomusa sp. KB1]|jgi:anaerobic selenocysteine-containing dehydrogenase|uniref:molybdopterin-containing oxidoreductase family protein n=1 Tax=Sporomusa sp. KB1 TaxID=943346 RepID=UPI0011A13FFF|nr:molybdopterin-dependent oxidoreductase [Sporomusa sp. KB1]TWH49218.1 anaerobic selenocysteine-containing dehydrogenase [Sporomusa sp. KB1]